MRQILRERTQLGGQLLGRHSLRCPLLQSCSSLTERPLVVLMTSSLQTVLAVIRGLGWLQQAAASRERLPLREAAAGRALA